MTLISESVCDLRQRQGKDKNPRLQKRVVYDQRLKQGKRKRKRKEKNFEKKKLKRK